jgi:adenosylhomocysteine/aminodeoxyfutalosine nucleosidase
MKIAIMGAMREEIEPLLEFFGKYETIDYAGNTYYETTYKNLDIVIAYSKIGKVNSAITASVMCEKFKAEKLLFSGVAGAVSDELRVGDLIIADKLVQHDVDITAFGHPFGFIPESGDFVRSDERLNELAKKVANELAIKLMVGAIATGDQFVASEDKKNWIRDTYKADALEMEGASVARVCECFGVPFMVLRAISDAADMDAGFSFDEFLVSSAKVSAKFLIQMLDELSNG